MQSNLEVGRLKEKSVIKRGYRKEKKTFTWVELYRLKVREEWGDFYENGFVQGFYNFGKGGSIPIHVDS